jgi:hypothetical protein
LGLKRVSSFVILSSIGNRKGEGIIKHLSVLLLSLLLLPACGGLNFSKTYPGAQGFRPRKIVVLPVTVGDYETAQELVEDVLAKSLWATGWYKQVVAPHIVRDSLAGSPEFSQDVSSYIVLLNTLGASDKLRAKEIGRVYQAQALLVTSMTDWGYGWVEGEKMAWLALGLTLVDAKTGNIVWRAKHKLRRDYWQTQPALGDLCEELLGKMLQEMPH